MADSMWEDGNNMEMEKVRKVEKESNLATIIFMMEIFMKEKGTEKADYNIKMETIMKEIGKMGKCMEKEYFSINIILLFMMESGKTENNKEKVR